MLIRKFIDYFQLSVIRAIIIYDDLEAGEVLSDFLTIKGVDIVGIGYTSEQAIEMYKEYKPDVIILELKIPEHDGKNAIDEIKKIHSAAKIIVISNSSSYKIDKNKISDYFVKPYDIDKFISTIKKITVKNGN